MGNHKNISHERFPKQGYSSHPNEEYRVSEKVWGIYVRRDIEEPFKSIIEINITDQVKGYLKAGEIELPERQGPFLNKRVEIVYHYDVSNAEHGTIVRDDIDEPYLTIIKTDTGKFIFSTECQYS